MLLTHTTRALTLTHNSHRHNTHATHRYIHSTGGRAHTHHTHDSSTHTDTQLTYTQRTHNRAGAYTPQADVHTPHTRLVFC